VHARLHPSRTDNFRPSAARRTSLPSVHPYTTLSTPNPNPIPNPKPNPNPNSYRNLKLFNE